MCARPARPRVFDIGRDWIIKTQGKSAGWVMDVGGKPGHASHKFPDYKIQGLVLFFSISSLPRKSQSFVQEYVSGIRDILIVTPATIPHFIVPYSLSPVPTVYYVLALSPNVLLKQLGIVIRAAVLSRHINSLPCDWWTVRNKRRYPT